MPSLSAPSPNAKRLAAHGVLLLAVLLALWAVMRPEAVFHADEGAALAQERLLDRTGDWTAPNPQPLLDPEMEALPLELSDRFADGGWSPYLKHPVYPLLLRGASTLVDDLGPILVSVLGTVAAAAAAAALANRLSPGSGPIALWVTGVGTPLLFHSYVVQAHTVGAALVGWSAFALCRSLDANTRARVVLVVGACVLVAAAVWLRTEALFAGVALGGVATVVGRVRWPAILTACAVVVAAAGAWQFERSWLIEPLGGQSTGAVSSGREVIERGTGQLESFRITWLDSGYGHDWPEILFGTTGAVAAWCVAVGGRRSPKVLQVGAAIAAVAYLLRASELGLVPGLLIAFPALAGVAAAPASVLRSRTGELLFGSWVLFSVAVLATQYSNGGGANWGGRFFAVGVPLIVPVAVAGWRSLHARAGREVRRIFTVSAAAVLGALALLSVVSMRDERNAVASLVDAILAARDGGEAPEGPLPVLATTGIPTRFAWEHVEEGVWLTVDPDAARRYGERLASESERIVLVSFELELDIAQLDEWWDVEREVASTVAVLQRR